MSNYAQIPTGVICRFSELTKREIAVLCYLYAARNRKTGQCNPSRSHIARVTNLGRSHVYEAINGLASKGWLAEDQDGYFALIEDPPPFKEQPQTKLPFVPKSGTTNLPETGNQVVPKSGTDVKPEPVPESGTRLYPNRDTFVPKSGTDCTQNGYKHIKDSSEQKNEQKKEQNSSTSKKQCKEVFENWQSTLDHPKATLGKKRESKIRARLAEGYSVETLKRVAIGVKYSRYHMGDNDSGTRYDDIVTIYRDEAQVEKFLALADLNEPINADGPCPPQQPDDPDEQGRLSERFASQLPTRPSPIVITREQPRNDT